MQRDIILMNIRSIKVIFRETPEFPFHKNEANIQNSYYSSYFGILLLLIQLENHQFILLMMKILYISRIEGKINIFKGYVQSKFSVQSLSIILS